MHSDRYAASQVARATNAGQVTQAGFVRCIEGEGLASGRSRGADCAGFGGVGCAVGDGFDLLADVCGIGWVVGLQADCRAVMAQHDADCQLVRDLLKLEHDRNARGGAFKVERGLQIHGRGECAAQPV